MLIDIVIILVLVALAILLLILEMFFLPGLSVAGFMSVLFYGVALYYSFVHMGVTAGVITLVVAVVATVFFIWYFMRSRTLDKMSLHTNIDATAPTEVASTIKVGDEGVALSRLNPMGRVLIGDASVEARAYDFIEENTAVKVVKIERTTIVVEPVKEINKQ
ncbi:MAG: NfeD family protein [Bacteroidaceae bacterium]|nr:NfeD family protein [Bacteroidaceae bacterium]